MDGFAHRLSVGTLFTDDFDAPEVAAEPAVVEPAFSASDVAAAREAAWREGHAAGLQEASTRDASMTQQAVTTLAEQFATERLAAGTYAEQCAQSIARLLVEALAAAFPALCESYGDAEVRAIVRTVLPSLTQEPVIAVRAHPRTAAALAQEIAQLEPDLATHVKALACDDMQPGDVRIVWRNGAAKRDASALWQQIAAILAPAGLLSTGVAIREMVDGD
jgi:flagellar assembly protein FliH